MSDKKDGAIELQMQFNGSIKRDDRDYIKAYAQMVLDGGRPNRPYIRVDFVRLFAASAPEVPLTAEIRLSAQTIASHRHHKEATAEAYAAMPFLLLRRGIWVRRRKDRRISVYKDIGAKIWEQGIKRTKNAEIYIPALHYCERRKYEKMRKEEILAQFYTGK